MAEKKKKFYKFSGYVAELFDYDYLHKLNEEEKQFLYQFHEEEFNGSYLEFEDSIHSHESFDDFQNDESFPTFIKAFEKECASRIKKLAKIQNKEWLDNSYTKYLSSKIHKNNKLTREGYISKLKRKYRKITAAEFFIRIKQRLATQGKTARREDIFNNYNNLSNGNFYSKRDSKTIEKKFVKRNKEEDLKDDNENEYNLSKKVKLEDLPIEDTTERDRFRKYVHEKTVHLYAQEALVSFFETLQSEKKQDFIDRLNELRNQFESREIYKSVFVWELYQIFLYTKSVFPDRKPLLILNKVFDIVLLSKKTHIQKKFIKES